MKTFLCVVLGVILVLSVGYAAHDLVCYEIIEPSGDYLEADSAIAPKLGIANLGDEAELNFAVHFIVINEEEEDTVFADTTIVDYIGPYPDSIEVELDEWVPEGICQDVDWDDDGPFVYYDLLGIVNLEIDEERANDTVRDSVTCLWSHDVGVTYIELGPEPEPPDHYPPDSEITITATLENFGYHMEHDVPVRCEIMDEGADPDTLVYNNIQVIADLDWRGNPYDNPYQVDVTFPKWTRTSGNMLYLTCRTEMEGDQCPDDDFESEILWPEPVEEAKTAYRVFRLEVLGTMTEDNCLIRFAVPYSSRMRLDVFDVNGRWVKSIANDIFKAGHYTRSWDCRDAAGCRVATGVYLIRMQADEFNAVRKLVVVN